MHAISSYRGNRIIKSIINHILFANRPTNKQTHRQGRLHYTAPQLTRNVITLCTIDVYILLQLTIRGISSSVCCSAPLYIVTLDKLRRLTKCRIIIIITPVLLFYIPSRAPLLYLWRVHVIDYTLITRRRKSTSTALVYVVYISG